MTITDLDGNVFYDLTGSYGVNVFGVDFYKACIADGHARVQALGPVLGSYHPCVADNVQRLCRLSGMDEVSFHMSGTEAVMQAVRLARYHSGRKHLVRFSGAYHGWWDDVQPGPGNPLPPRDTYTLREMDPRTLAVLRSRRDIACVLVNPLQALHPNAAAPGDSTLLDGSRHAHFDRDAYTRWLRELRDGVQRARHRADLRRGVRRLPAGSRWRAAVFRRAGRPGDLRQDAGRRLADRRGVRALALDEALSRRSPGRHLFRPRHVQLAPVRDGCDAGVPRALRERADPGAVRRASTTRWNARAVSFNQRMRAEGLPLHVANLSSIWTIGYDVPSRYNWMLQFYLRAHGLALSWVGTGRLIFSLNYTRGRLRRGARALRGRRARDAGRRLVVASPAAIEPVDPSRAAARDAGAAVLVPPVAPARPQRWFGFGSINWPRSRYSGDFQYRRMS